MASLRKACEGVAYAHSRGVVHRDLKPQNVMLGAFGEVVVLDWGMAQVRRLLRDVLEEVDTPGGPAIDVPGSFGIDPTRMGTVKGTVSYMAPEQARGEWDRLDRRADIYSIGAMLFEILQGRAAREGSAKDRMRAATSGERPRWRKAGVLPDSLVELTERCMAPDPADRPDGMEGVLRALAGWLEGAANAEKAQERVDASDALQREIDGLMAQAELHWGRARSLAARLPAGADEARLEPVWEAEDCARDHES